MTCRVSVYCPSELPGAAPVAALRIHGLYPSVAEARDAVTRMAQEQVDVQNRDVCA